MTVWVRSARRKRLLSLVVGASEIRRGGVLSLLDDAAPYGAGAREEVEQALSVVCFDHALQRLQISVEAAEHIEHGALVGKKNIAPHGRVRGRDAGEIAKAGGGKLDDLRLRDLFEVGRRADDVEGD